MGSRTPKKTKGKISNDEFNSKLDEDIKLFLQSKEYEELGIKVTTKELTKWLRAYFYKCKMLLESFIDIRLGLLGIIKVNHFGIKHHLLKTLDILDRMMPFNVRVMIYSLPSAKDLRWKIDMYVDDVILLVVHFENNPAKVKKDPIKNYYRYLINKVFLKYLILYNEPFKIPRDLESYLDLWIDNKNLFEIND